MLRKIMFKNKTLSAIFFLVKYYSIFAKPGLNLNCTLLVYNSN